MIKYENLLKESKVYKNIMSDKHNGNLSHCIMIISEDSIACDNLCLLIARGLICERDNCGKCKNCLEVENNVNSSLIIPESLNAEGIRNFLPRCYQVVDGPAKVVLIRNFQNIDSKLQNKLLKLLEEPIGNTVFILGVTKIASVLDTIKSRATKLYIDGFERMPLQKALEENFNAFNVAKAIDFAEGSLTKAINILSNDDFNNSYDVISKILIEMDHSSKVVEMLSMIDISKTQSYLDIMEIIIKQVLERKTGLSFKKDDDIDKMCSIYNIATLVNIEDLVIDAKRKIEQRCYLDGVMFKVLMGILEVKYKCQL